jgi:hypothetical protein
LNQNPSPGKRVLEHQLAEVQQRMQEQYESFERALAQQRAELRTEAEEFVAFSKSKRTDKFKAAATEYRYETNLAMQLQNERACTELKYFQR